MLGIVGQCGALAVLTLSFIKFMLVNCTSELEQNFMLYKNSNFWARPRLYQGSCGQFAISWLHLSQYDD